MMATLGRLLVLACALIALLGHDSSAQDTDEQGSKQQALKINTRANRANDGRHDEQNSINEIDVTSSKDFNTHASNRSVVLAEPHKSLGPTNAPNDTETAAGILKDAGHLLPKPIEVLRAASIFARFAVSPMGSRLAVRLIMWEVGKNWPKPPTYWLTRLTTVDLDRYLSNGVSEHSLLEVVGARTGEALRRVGLGSRLCMETCMCRLAELLHHLLPRSSQTVLEFGGHNFSNNSNALSDNPMAQAFVWGFVDRNCSLVASRHAQAKPRWLDILEPTSCLGNWLEHVLSSRLGTEQQKGLIDYMSEAINYHFF